MVGLFALACMHSQYDRVFKARSGLECHYQASGHFVYGDPLQELQLKISAATATCSEKSGPGRKEVTSIKAVVMSLSEPEYPLICWVDG
jgi:hypothetical protein